MEVAKLIGDEVDIERERRDLVTLNKTWHEIVSLLNDKYRQISRKNGFLCLCCLKPVEFVLHESKVCFFRHKDKMECMHS